MSIGDVSEQTYPPDEYLELPRPLSFTRVLVGVVFVVVIFEFVIVGNPPTPIPFNYPFYFGVVYLVGAVFVLKRMHSIFDSVKRELVDIAERTDTGDELLTRQSDVTSTQIRKEIECISSCAFHPMVLLAGAAFSGFFAVGVMGWIGVLDAYPYLLMDFAYGAGHGLFYGPLAGAVYLVYKLSNCYIVDIDLLDPDGVGGYRQVGDAIVSLITYGIVLVTADFVILSSVSFVGEPVFTTAVFVIYVAMLGFFAAFTVFGVTLIRRRLLDLREQKTAAMRERFIEVEDRFWEKQRAGVDPQQEADSIRTMQTLFTQLYNMNLWPLNLLSFARLALSTAASLTIAAWEAGVFNLPFV